MKVSLPDTSYLKFLPFLLLILFFSLLESRKRSIRSQLWRSFFKLEKVSTFFPSFCLTTTRLLYHLFCLWAISWIMNSWWTTGVSWITISWIMSSWWTALRILGERTFLVLKFPFEYLTMSISNFYSSVKNNASNFLLAKAMIPHRPIKGNGMGLLVGESIKHT